MTAPSQLRQTHTVVTLGLSQGAFDEISTKLRAAGYDHAFMPDGEVDMSGIAVAPDTEAEPATTFYFQREEAKADPFALVRVTEWPKERRVGRREDMSPTGHLEVMLDGDSDVIVAVTTGSSVQDFAQASVEFCTVGVGGGGSPRTRAALVALMVAIEADNAECPRKQWPPAEGRASGTEKTP